MSAIIRAARPATAGTTNQKQHPQYSRIYAEVLVKSIIYFLFGALLAWVILAAFAITKWVDGLGVI